MFISSCSSSRQSCLTILSANAIDRTVDIYSEPSAIPALPISTCTPVSLPPSRLNCGQRREFVWMTYDKSSTLEVISKQVENFLFRLWVAPTQGHIQHHAAQKLEHIHCQCPGYGWEEVYLGLREESSFIIFHSTLSPQEMCTVCRKIVEASGCFRCPCRKTGEIFS